MTDTSASADSRRLFDANAESYDRVNTIMSLGLDARWRDWVARKAVVRPHARVLDAFAGTGLVGLAAARRGAEVTLADVSEGMLEVAQRRAHAAGVSFDATIVTDLEAQPERVPGAPFDAVTMGFGARYLEDPSRVIRGLAALLAADGRFVLMDVVEPEPGFLHSLAGIYFFRILPSVAAALAGKRELYDKLTSSTRSLGRRAHLLELVRDAGLEIVETRVTGLGMIVGVVAVPKSAA